MLKKSYTGYGFSYTDNEKKQISMAVILKYIYIFIY